MRRKEVLPNFEAQVEEGRKTVVSVYNTFITEKKAENCSPYTIRYYDNGAMYPAIEILYTHELDARNNFEE